MFAIARHELRLSWRDGRLVASLAGLVLLLAAALWVHQGRTTRERAEQERLAAELRREWLGQGEVNPHSAAHFGTFAQRPVSALAALDPGVDAHLGRTLRLEAHVQHDFAHRPAGDEGAARALGALSPALVLQLFAPLLLLLWSANSFASERERGTLGLALFSARSPLVLAAGKLCAGLVLAALLVTPFALLGVALARTPDERHAALLLGATYFAYLAAFTGLGASVGLLARDSSRALLAALVLWAGACVLLPRLAVEAGDAAHPLASRAEFEHVVNTAAREGIDGHNPRDERRKQLEREVLARYQVADLAALPVNFDGLVMQADEDYRAKVYDKHYGALFEQLELQARTASRFALLSPLAALRPLSMALAGTGVERAVDFARGAAQYRLEMVRVLNDAMTYGSKSGDWEWKAGLETWSKVGELHCPPPSFESTVHAQRRNLLALAAWSLVALGAALTLTRRWTP
jgi:ABC-2 type transport system permease protein